MSIGDNLLCDVGGVRGFAGTGKSVIVDNEFYFSKGRVALYALLRALNVGPSHDIIVSVYTCPDVISPIVGLGARPVYCDIERDTFGLCPRALAAALTDSTRVVIVQHTFGIPARLDQLREVVRHRGVAILEDCCHVSASTYHGLPLGQVGEGAFYSHDWGKPLSAGGGGVAVVNSAEFLEKVTNTYSGFTDPSLAEEAQMIVRNTFIGTRKMLRSWLPGLHRALRPRRHAQAPVDSFGFLLGKLGPEYGKRIYKSSFGCLRHVENNRSRRISARKWSIKRYENGFRNLGIECFGLPSGCEAAFWRYPLWAIDKFGILNEASRSGLHLLDWGTIPLTALSNACPVGHQSHRFPIAESVAQHLVTLVIEENKNEREIDRNLQFLRDMKKKGLI
jgi:perosamine synthetase